MDIFSYAILILCIILAPLNIYAGFKKGKLFNLISGVASAVGAILLGASMLIV